jgi:hypothetical protein
LIEPVQIYGQVGVFPLHLRITHAVRVFVLRKVETIPLAEAERPFEKSSKRPEERIVMLRKTLLGAVACVALTPELAYAYGGGYDADSMRRSAAAYATNPADRCPNLDGSQFWFLEWPPNCAAPGAQQWRR